MVLRLLLFHSKEMHPAPSDKLTHPPSLPPPPLPKNSAQWFSGCELQVTQVGFGAGGLGITLQSESIVLINKAHGLNSCPD